jgi:hypothetical protein
LRHPNNDVSQHFGLASKAVPRLTEGFSIEKVLLIEVDLRQILGADLYFDPTGGAGGIPTTIVIQHKPKQLRRF